MHFPLFIAKRYLISKKKQNIINIISGISIAGIVVGTMALVIVVSVLNGFNNLLGQFYSSFDPDLKITSVEGKMFDPEKSDFDKIKALPEVVHYAEIIEEMALLKYKNQIYPAIVKGVPANYGDYTGIDSLLINGSFKLKEDGINYAVVGRGVAYNLNIGLSFIDHIMVYVPKRGKQVSLNPARAINHNYIYPAGIFAVLDEIDSKYLIVDYEFARDLFESNDQISSVEIDLSAQTDYAEVQKKIQKILGPEFHVKNKYQQHDLIFRTMKSEKLWVYIILVFILILSSGNMIGNLTLLIIDKKEDILMMQSMGATTKQIKKIFLFEGWLISLIGALAGTLLGIFVCWLQVKYEIITFPEGSFAVNAYPVQIVLSDILLSFATVMIIGFLVSLYPVNLISRKYLLK